MVDSTDAKPTQSDQQPELCGGTTGFIMMILILITFFIMFNPDLREGIALGLDGAFNPIFGFGGKYPGLTLLCTAIFMVFFSTTIRHFMTDWVGIAKAQKMMSAFQKERTDAMLSGNTMKLKKLEELNPEITKKQMVLMTANLKPIVFTMLFFIIVFPWIWSVYFPQHLQFQYFTLPWLPKLDLTTPLPFCGGGNIGNWLFIYILLSIPIGFLIQNGLKYVTFTRKIKLAEVGKEHEIEDEISILEGKIKEAEKNGITVSRSKQLITKAREDISEKNYTHAGSQISEAENYLERKTQSHGRVTLLISQAEKMITNAENKGISVISASKSLAQAKKSFKRKDETSAIYYAKQSQRQVKDSRVQHKGAEDTLSTVKALMYDLRELNTADADSIFDQAQKAMDNKEYDKVVKLSKESKQKAEEIKNIHIEAGTALEKAKSLLETIKHLELEVPQANELYDKAKTAFDDHKYQLAFDTATQCIELTTTEKEKFQEAQDSVSFAKLVISNAISFGASVVDAEKLAADAELALSAKNYDRAIELANSAKDTAEQAKRQLQRISKRK